MNDFESSLASALRAEAEEVAACVDGTRAAHQLESRLDRVDHGRRRRIWVSVVAVGAAAAVISVIALAGRATCHAAPIQPIGPSPTSAPTPPSTSSQPLPSKKSSGALSLEPLSGSPGQYGWATRTAGLAVGPTGTIYVWDLDSATHRFRIRSITPTGHVMSTADAPSAGWDAGFGAVAVDGSGNVYVAASTAIRKIGLDGQVSTLAGGAKPGIGRRNREQSKVRRHGRYGHLPHRRPLRQRRRSGAQGHPEGKVDTLTACAYPQPTTGCPPDCLGWPDGIAVGPTGTIFIGPDDYRIRTITPDGKVTELAVGDLGGAGLFHRMSSFALDPWDSSLVVTTKPDGTGSPPTGRSAPPPKCWSD